MARIKRPVDLPEPTPELVRQYITAFDEQGVVTEAALHGLFTAFPSNTDVAEVLLKVIVVNRIYSTSIYAVVPVAEMIAAAKIDDLLRAGKQEAVECIRRVSFEAQSGLPKQLNIYSFATKYCALHQPQHYVMYDGLVIEKLRQYQVKTQAEGTPFYSAFSWDDLKDYSKFKSIVEAFQRHFRLGNFTLREVDKFLWILGKKMLSEQSSTAAQSGETL